MAEKEVIPTDHARRVPDDIDQRIQVLAFTDHGNAKAVQIAHLEYKRLSLVPKVVPGFDVLLDATPEFPENLKRRTRVSKLDPILHAASTVGGIY